MDSLVIIGLLLLGGFAIAAAKKHDSVDGMEDTPVSLDNIRKGVANGWYTAELGVYNDTPCIKLTGKDVDGKTKIYYNVISKEDWITLRDQDKIPVIAHWIDVQE